MLYYWQINNNYEDDSIFLDNHGSLNEKSIREEILNHHVSYVLYDKDIPIHIVQKLKEAIPEVTFKRSYEPRIYIRSLRQDCCQVQNPVLALDGSIIEPFHLKKLQITSDSVSSQAIAEETVAHPGRRVIWSCCNPANVILDFFKKITFHKPITYLECCTQFGESFRYVCDHLPQGSSLYAVDFWNKVKGFPMNPGQEENYHIHRIGFKGNCAYNETVENLIRENPDLHLDLAFYDANHKSRDDRALRALSKISDILIVHDANFEEVTTMCQGIFGDAPFELHGNKSTEAYSRIYILNRSDKWTIN